jgi:hypothetical protein
MKSTLTTETSASQPKSKPSSRSWCRGGRNGKRSKRKTRGYPKREPSVLRNPDLLATILGERSGKLRRMIKLSEELKPFVGHLVKVVFRDGYQVIAKRGKLVSVSENFAELRTLESVILIRTSEILKVQRSLGGGKSGKS